MKVCILTYRLHSNFGFLMQAYALQQIVKALGHDPYTVDIRVKPFNFKESIKHMVKSVLLYTSRRVGYTALPWITSEEQAYIDCHTWQFLEAKLQLTPSVKSIRDLKHRVSHQYDFYLVGSDQVWRKEYFSRIQTYFFDFLSDDKKRASYAASFGVSNPNYSPQMVKICRNLLAKFSAVSVREADGVRICKEIFGVSAVHVLDPTLLFDKSMYLELIDPNDKVEFPSPSFILVYILDKTIEKIRFVEEFAQKMHLKPYFIKPENINEVGVNRIEECVYPSISTWINAFEKADFVITDSFHGTVFSIIFQKQFIVLDNPQRGSNRLKSLLSDFLLMDRLFNLDNKTNLNFKLIDYNKVNEIWLDKKEKSISFLERVLCE